MNVIQSLIETNPNSRLLISGIMKRIKDNRNIKFSEIDSNLDKTISVDDIRLARIIFILIRWISTKHSTYSEQSLIEKYPFLRQYPEKVIRSMKVFVNVFILTLIEIPDINIGLLERLLTVNKMFGSKDESIFEGPGMIKNICSREMDIFRETRDLDGFTIFSGLYSN